MAAGWEALRRFHDAVTHFNAEEQARARTQFAVAAEAMPGSCINDRIDELGRRLIAEEGAEPLFGQAFDRVVDIGGCQCQLKYDGFMSLGFVCCYAVDLEAPFISKTGYLGVDFSSRTAPFCAGEFASKGSAFEHAQAVVRATAADKKGAIALVPVDRNWTRMGGMMAEAA